jgi:5-methylcytosine-specific restriction enzyme B
MSLVWVPSESGSVAILIIGTDGFGTDVLIVGSSRHHRHLKALSRLYGGRYRGEA